MVLFPKKIKNRPDGRSSYFYVDGVDAFGNDVGYTYASGSNRVSEMTSGVVDYNGDTVSTTTYNYTYDDNGNITQIKNASGVIQNQYHYDDLGQLIREDNRALNKTYVWTYDNAGNILNRKAYAFTTGTISTSVQATYTYGYSSSGWKDQLTSYNGQTITYDSIGNPLMIYTNNDAYQIGYLLEWEGRQLKSYSEFESSDINYPDVLDSFTYTYNADGIRTSKMVYGITYEYILNGSQPIGMRWTESGTEYLMLFIYDDMGAPIALKYRTSAYAVGVFDTYFFEKNLQGDIIAIYDETGSQIGTYKYTAWGSVSWSCASGTSAFEYSLVYNLNPFRYRGYIYDFETGLYYLQSRYYNPNWGRFLNADGYVSTGTGLLGYNMYAYCNNNPVMLIDAEGSFPWLVVLLVSTVLLLNSCSSDSEARTRNVSVTPGNFETVEEAVENFGDTYFFKSIQEDREYAAIIHEEQKGDSTYYTYSVVSIGSRDRVTPYFPSGKNAVAVVHTHGDRAVDQDGESFSNKDINFSIRHDIPIYVFTPNKNLRRFDPQTNEEETISWDGGG